MLVYLKSYYKTTISAGNEKTAQRQPSDRCELDLDGFAIAMLERASQGPPFIGLWPTEAVARHDREKAETGEQAPSSLGQDNKSVRHPTRAGDYKR